MRLRGSRGVHAAFGVLVLCLAGAALSWACTPSANVAISPSVGPAGSQVALTGRSFAPNETVQITLNGLGGPVLGTAATNSQGVFSASVTIPASSPADTYTISARGAEGFSSASFLVPGAAPSPEESSPAPAPAGRQEAPTPAERSPVTSQTADGSDTAQGRNAARAVTRGDARTGARVAEPEGITKLSSGTPVFADSAPSRAEAGSRTRAGKAGKGSTGSRGTVPAASAAGDLWSGFESERASAVLGGSSGGQVQEQGSVPVLSMALAGIGLAAVLAGTGAAALRRRRSYVPSGRGPTSD